jgi:hypothetical protein
MKRFLVAVPLLAATWASGQGAVFERPRVEAWVPPAVAKAAETMPRAKRGDELKAEVERRLRADFEAAAPAGSLTREQARAAGLGFITNHFEAIDRAGRGAVRYEDYRTFLRSRGGFIE